MAASLPARDDKNNMNQRPIKFRAWDKEKNEMRHGNFFVGGIYGEVFTKEEIQGEGVVNPPERFILEQFTGLLDKNGKEIWEGDIVRLDGSVMVVKWEETLEEQGNAYGFYFPSILNRPEVIGNIHQNPELVAAKES